MQGESPCTFLYAVKYNVLLYFTVKREIVTSSVLRGGTGGCPLCWRQAGLSLLSVSAALTALCDQTPNFLIASFLFLFSKKIDLKILEFLG